MLEWRTLNQQVAYSCDGFDIINETVELPDGATTQFDFLSEGESVIILPFTPDGAVVVIDEWRHAVERVNHGLPAGSLDEGESPAEAVDRELAEETGYRPAEIEHMTSVEPANGFADAVFHYFLAKDCKHVTEQSLDRDESITVSTTSIDELRAAIRSDELRDGRSAFGIMYYLLFIA